MIQEAYNSAITILQKCSTKNGFFAAFPGYDMVFARDSMIISLGASLLPEFKGTIKKSLITLANNQSNTGQIPNAVDKFSNRKHHVDYLSIDSTLWFLIGHYNYKKHFDSQLFSVQKNNIESALTWLKYQDIAENGMLVQQPTTDWQDAFPHKYGHTINTQALWFNILQQMNKKSDAEKLLYNVNINNDTRLWNDNFYLSYRWKNHGKYQEKGEWFDSLGNLLAIIFGLSNEHQTKKIINYIIKNKIDQPYPIKAIYPPITKSSKHWQDYYLDCEAGKPHHYLNGGIWTFIGGFYVLALIKDKHFKEAEKQLQKLAEANLKYNFTEWLHGITGKDGDTEAKIKSVQGWNAGMYILAYESLKHKKVLL
ncbi:hypothetical protein J4456_00735 [Candidatus Pacearchaeota archaeon]|nr:hypothetical protein [Candidatus Pacearchaeota archaeon]